MVNKTSTTKFGERKVSTSFDKTSPTTKLSSKTVSRIDKPFKSAIKSGDSRVHFTIPDVTETKEIEPVKDLTSNEHETTDLAHYVYDPASEFIPNEDSPTS